MIGWRAVALVACAVVALSHAADAQPTRRSSSAPPDPIRGEVGIQGVLAIPVGEFGDYVGLGGGVNAHGLYFVYAQKLGLRLDGSALVYGSTTVRRPLSPTVPFVEVDVTTSNTISSLTLGPQMVLRSGRLEAFAYLTAGFSDFTTTTSVEGSNPSGPFASSTNFDDATFAWLGGGGVRYVVGGLESNPVSIELGARHQRHGLTEYLREGGLTTGPGGEVIASPIRSRTNLVNIHLGVSVSLR